MAYSASMLFLDTLQQAGVSCIFANFGSDHPALVEALAEAAATGRAVPRLFTCPNEMVALSAAQGHAQLSGQAQAVIVHVECGTQALAGAVHNAAKGRAPVFIFAGLSPFTQEGELPGSRNEFIQWIQDVPDQRGIVRGYVKYENEFRTAANIPQITFRAMQFAHSDPQGPVYVTGAREVMEAEAAPQMMDRAAWPPIAGCALPPQALDLVDDLLSAKNPLIVTSYLGRNPAAVHALTKLARRLGIGVLESVPNCVNFPTDDPLYQGNQWNHPKQNEALAAADLVLVIDSDVPWIPTVSKPSPGAKIYHIDVDPLKQQMPLWYIHAQHIFRADAQTALDQLNTWLDDREIDPSLTAARTARQGARHAEWRAALDTLETPPNNPLTPEFVVATLRKHLDETCIILNEGISNYHTVINHLRLNKPGTLHNSGGGSLGWHGGAAIGAKLARPDATIIALTGDGSYMFSVPSSVHWMARRYETPFLTIIFNNNGWKSPKLSALALHPNGYASRAENPGVGFAPPPNYAAIAAAAGQAFARTVTNARDLDTAITEALNAVRTETRAAVLDIVVPGL
jgi:acetolactate synthase-1/2/3 large subunit